METEAGDDKSARERTDTGHWASAGTRITIPGAQGRMVDGKLVTGPIQGFGKMWQKTYRVPLAGVPATPAEVITTWKRHFPEFWPDGNQFHAPLTGIAPGEVALLDISLGPGRGSRRASWCSTRTRSRSH